MSAKNIADCVFATQHGDIITVTVHVLQNHVSPNSCGMSVSVLFAYLCIFVRAWRYVFNN